MPQAKTTTLAGIQVFVAEDEPILLTGRRRATH
jgi:hypothetical protein